MAGGEALSDVPGHWAGRAAGRWEQERWEQERWEAVPDWARQELRCGGTRTVIGTLAEFGGRHPRQVPSCY